MWMKKSYFQQNIYKKIDNKAAERKGKERIWKEDVLKLQETVIFSVMEQLC